MVDTVSSAVEDLGDGSGGGAGATIENADGGGGRDESVVSVERAVEIAGEGECASGVE